LPSLKFQERTPSKEDNNRSSTKAKRTGTKGRDDRKSKSRDDRKSKSRDSSKSKSRDSSKSKSWDSSKSGTKELLLPTLIAKAAHLREAVLVSPEEEARLKKRVCKIF